MNKITKQLCDTICEKIEIGERIVQREYDLVNNMDKEDIISLICNRYDPATLYYYGCDAFNEFIKHNKNDTIKWNIKKLNKSTKKDLIVAYIESKFGRSLAYLILDEEYKSKYERLILYTHIVSSINELVNSTDQSIINNIKEEIRKERIDNMYNDSGYNIKKINSFEGNWYFLSNFYMHPVTYKGITYTNNEAAFQAQKCSTDLQKYDFCNLNPSQAKRLGRRTNLIPDWEVKKYQIMYEICWEKFRDPNLRRKLLQTQDAILIEGNTWHDNIWGACRCKRCSTSTNPTNYLGRILMDIRSRIREENNK